MAHILEGFKRPGVRYTQDDRQAVEAALGLRDRGVLLLTGNNAVQVQNTAEVGGGRGGSLCGSRYADSEII